MGYYINPPDMSKEDFLKKNGTLVKESDVMEADLMNDFPVVLIDNGLFTAAGILYDGKERDYWLQSCKKDVRLHLFYLVEKKHLIPYLPEKL